MTVESCHLSLQRLWKRPAKACGQKQETWGPCGSATSPGQASVSCSPLPSTARHHLPPSRGQDPLPPRNGWPLQPWPHLELRPHRSAAVSLIAFASSTCWVLVSRPHRERGNSLSPAHPSVPRLDGPRGHIVDARRRWVRWQTGRTGGGERRGSGEAGALARLPSCSHVFRQR